MIGVLAAIALAVGLMGEGRTAEEQLLPFYPQEGILGQRLRAAGATAAATAG